MAAGLAARRLVSRKRDDEEPIEPHDSTRDDETPAENPYASQATPAHAELAFECRHMPTAPPLAFAPVRVENQRVVSSPRSAFAMLKPIVIPKPAERLSDAEFKAAPSRPRAVRTERPPVTVYDEPRPEPSKLRRAAGIACALISVICFSLFAWNWFPRATATRAAVASASVNTNSAAPSIIPIEEITTRHEVLAYDPARGKHEWKPVEKLFRRTSFHLRYVTVESESGELQTFETTDEHPFWLPDRNGFLEAGKLRAGDRLLAPQGHLAAVTATHRDEHPEGVDVFNFRVKDLHTYYVQARGTRAPPVLVHNMNDDGCGLGGSKSLGDVADAAKERSAPVSLPDRNVPQHVGPRALPDGDLPWQKYQRHVTGQNHEDVWKVGDRVVAVDGHGSGYLVEAKWTGRNEAAWRSSPYNPSHEYYNETSIIKQVGGYLELNDAAGGKGVRYAVSNEAAKAHFDQLFRTHFPDAVQSGALRVYYVPGNGM